MTAARWTVERMRVSAALTVHESGTASDQSRLVLSRRAFGYLFSSPCANYKGVIRVTLDTSATGTFEKFMVAG